LRTKYEGEKAVKEEFPDVTIFRPSDIYGQEDRFMRYYAHFWRRSFQWLPLWHRGEKTIKQPVFIGDVAQAVLNALKDPESVGKTYDIVG
jgi:NADH dehydrogenase (ubiquinone) 1 alpha subcomplex subunit 9